MSDSGGFRFMISNICSAVDAETIGSKIIRWMEFKDVLVKALRTYDFAKCAVSGQGFILLPDATEFVSAGVGRRTGKCDDYVVRIHRGQASAYLRRAKAAKATGCAVVIYTVGAYIADPDITDEEHKRVMTEAPTHVIVAVLAYAGPQIDVGPPLSPYRLVWNLAGGNREAATWSVEDIQRKAQEAIEYDNQWITVAD